MSRFVASYGPVDARVRNLELWASRERERAATTAVVTPSGVVLNSFDSLDDVNLTDPTDGDIPIYDGTYWVNSQAYITTVPATLTRNTIQPTGDYQALVLKENASQSVNPFELQTSAGTVLIAMAAAGRFGVGTSTPTAWLHLRAGVATAGGAPLKLTAGANLTTPETGALEYDGTSLYFTIGSARYVVVPVVDSVIWSAAFATKTADYTLTSSDGSVLVDASGGAVTLTLPYAFGVAGRTYTVKKTDSSVNSVTVTAPAEETIDGERSVQFWVPFESLDFRSSGCEWEFVNTAGLTCYPVTVEDGVWDPTFVTKTSNYTIVTTDGTVLVDCTSGAVTITLPTAVGATGRTYTVRKVDGSTNAVTVATTSAQTIDGSASAEIAVPTTALDFRSDGSNWEIS